MGQSRRDDDKWPDRVITTREAAEILGVSPVTLRHWRCKGRGPKGCRPEGGRIMGYWLSDVLAYGREGSSGKV